jgi:hypothetical protein
MHLMNIRVCERGEAPSVKALPVDVIEDALTVGNPVPANRQYGRAGFSWVYC